MGVPSRSVLGEDSVAGCGAAAGKTGAGTASWATALVTKPILKAALIRTQEQMVAIIFIMNYSSYVRSNRIVRRTDLLAITLCRYF
jgi:hypothetical protein